VPGEIVEVVHDDGHEEIEHEEAAEEDEGDEEGEGDVRAAGLVRLQQLPCTVLNLILQEDFASEKVCYSESCDIILIVGIAFSNHTANEGPVRIKRSGPDLCIPRKESARLVISKTELYCSVSQFPHSCIFERFIYSQE
jgi:hypothetical protein